MHGAKSGQWAIYHFSKGVYEMKFNEAVAAIREARQTLRESRAMVPGAIEIIVALAEQECGLKWLTKHQLCDLKRKLRDFNMATGKWKS